jgi:hypothetical protein
MCSQHNISIQWEHSGLPKFHASKVLERFCNMVLWDAKLSSLVDRHESSLPSASPPDLEGFKYSDTWIQCYLNLHLH